MNIIASRQEVRERQVNQIVESIKSSSAEPDFKKWIIATMANLNLSRRTAREYVEVAFFKLGLKTSN